MKQMKPHIGVSALIIALSLWPAVQAGEVRQQPSIEGTVLLIELLERERDLAEQRPRGGMTQAQVESAFGAPQTRHRPVGEPPIARWVYEDFIVYFEYDRVIRAVSRRQ
ncbi:hypothetical protein ACN2MM_07895 [Alkalilimnicola ehrlichii MLHE-1]